MACRDGAGPTASAIEHASTRPRARRPARSRVGSGHHAHAAAPRPSVPSASSGPPAIAMAAPGICASTRAINAVTPRTATEAWVSSRPTAGSSPPVTAPLNPRSSARDTSGPTRAFASGASKESIPNAEARIGAVMSCATSVRLSALAATRKTPPSPAVSHRSIRLPKSSSPATASAESCSPRSKTDQGSMATTAMTALASDATPSPRRPAICPAPATSSISRDRNAEYGSPVTTA